MWRTASQLHQVTSRWRALRSCALILLLLICICVGLTYWGELSRFFGLNFKDEALDYRILADALDRSITRQLHTERARQDELKLRMTQLTEEMERVKQLEESYRKGIATLQVELDQERKLAAEKYSEAKALLRAVDRSLREQGEKVDVGPTIENLRHRAANTRSVPKDANHGPATSRPYDTNISKPISHELTTKSSHQDVDGAIDARADARRHGSSVSSERKPVSVDRAASANTTAPATPAVASSALVEMDDSVQIDLVDVVRFQITQQIPTAVSLPTSGVTGSIAYKTKVIAEIIVDDENNEYSLSRRGHEGGVQLNDNSETDTHPSLCTEFCQNSSTRGHNASTTGQNGASTSSTESPAQAKSQLHLLDLADPILLSDLVLFIAAAALAGVAAERIFSLPPSTGQLLAGCLMGAFGLSLIRRPVQTQTITQLGTVLLAFVLGTKILPRWLKHISFSSPNFEESAEASARRIKQRPLLLFSTTLGIVYCLLFLTIATSFTVMFTEITHSSAVVKQDLALRRAATSYLEKALPSFSSSLADACEKWSWAEQAAHGESDAKSQLSATLKRPTSRVTFECYQRVLAATNPKLPSQPALTKSTISNWSRLPARNLINYALTAIDPPNAVAVAGLKALFADSASVAKILPRKVDEATRYSGDLFLHLVNSTLTHMTTDHLNRANDIYSKALLPRASKTRERRVSTAALTTADATLPPRSFIARTLSRSVLLIGDDIDENGQLRVSHATLENVPEHLRPVSHADPMLPTWQSSLLRFAASLAGVDTTQLVIPQLQWYGNLDDPEERELAADTMLAGSSTQNATPTSMPTQKSGSEDAHAESMEMSGLTGVDLTPETISSRKQQLLTVIRNRILRKRSELLEDTLNDDEISTIALSLRQSSHESFEVLLPESIEHIRETFRGRMLLLAVLLLMSFTQTSAQQSVLIETQPALAEGWTLKQGHVIAQDFVVVIALTLIPVYCVTRPPLYLDLDVAPTAVLATRIATGAPSFEQSMEMILHSWRGSTTVSTALISVVLHILYLCVIYSYGLIHFVLSLPLFPWRWQSLSWQVRWQMLFVCKAIILYLVTRRLIDLAFRHLAPLLRSSRVSNVEFDSQEVNLTKASHESRVSEPACPPDVPISASGSNYLSRIGIRLDLPYVTVPLSKLRRGTQSLAASLSNGSLRVLSRLPKAVLGVLGYLLLSQICRIWCGSPHQDFAALFMGGVVGLTLEQLEVIEARNRALYDSPPRHDPSETNAQAGEICRKEAASQPLSGFQPTVYSLSEGAIASRSAKRVTNPALLTATKSPATSPKAANENAWLGRSKSTASALYGLLSACSSCSTGNRFDPRIAYSHLFIFVAFAVVALILKSLLLRCICYLANRFLARFISKIVPPSHGVALAVRGAERPNPHSEETEDESSSGSESNAPLVVRFSGSPRTPRDHFGMFEPLPIWSEVAIQDTHRSLLAVGDGTFLMISHLSTHYCLVARAYHVLLAAAVIFVFITSINSAVQLWLRKLRQVPIMPERDNGHQATGHMLNSTSSSDESSQ